ncbi:MAG: DUF389 domain-containing protein [Flavobacteriales bacterium]|nr:hypothetical protein [Flavobacteriaceae bacterium]RZP08046.1 MAG: DUF389 domain-containing protein [Flavobacteriales bacterium]|tara:strand:+ start:2194 stop:3675 length:1482 start_codon:yes stop_codon:yes gene_type:complete
MENKFNFSDENSSFKKSDNSISVNAKGLFSSMLSFFKEILDFRNETDKSATLNSIKNDISIKGPTAWILICSIFVASVGLNANSIPVVIGAMLISPLMGPILGFGLSIAINDLETLKKSVLNFSVMVVLSVFTAYLFFSFFPLREESSELLSRTNPDIRDVLIAFFGGLALIIAKTKKGTISTVIYGVAIATALMPPLCTVGYGLAIGKFEFASGAMYLFMINTLYIVLATYLIIKLLRFPLIDYVNSKRRRLVSRLVTLTSILMLIPAFYTFIGILYENKFNNSITQFLDFELDGIDNKDYLIINSKIEYDIDNTIYVFPWKDKISEITFNSFGLDPISIDIINLLKAKIKKYPHLSKTSINFNQQKTENDFKEQKRFLGELRRRDSLDLSNKTKEIELLTERLNNLEKIESKNILYRTLIEDVKLNYDQIIDFNLQNLFDINQTKENSKLLFYIKWSDSISENEIIKQEQKIKTWLGIKLSDESFELIRFR